MEIVTAYFEQLIFSSIDALFVIALGSVWVISAIYFFYYFGAVRSNKPIETTQKMPAASVVICARDAALHLEKHLEDWLNQDYPEFEIVVVDDCSADETAIYSLQNRKNIHD